LAQPALVPRERVEDSIGLAVTAFDQREALHREGRPGTIANDRFEAFGEARYVEVFIG
jgi:hypothetical protein